MLRYNTEFPPLPKTHSRALHTIEAFVELDDVDTSNIDVTGSDELNTIDYNFFRVGRVKIYNDGSYHVLREPRFFTFSERHIRVSARTPPKKYRFEYP
jgi:hypothetical protein